MMERYTSVMMFGVGYEPVQFGDGERMREYTGITRDNQLEGAVLEIEWTRIGKYI